MNIKSRAGNMNWETARKVAYALHLVMTTQELAVIKAEIADFFNSDGVGKPQRMEQSIGGRGTIERFLLFTDGDESSAGRYLALGGDGHWGYGFRGSGDVRAVPEYFGRTLPLYHFIRGWRLWRRGVPLLVVVVTLVGLDRSFRGPLSQLCFLPVAVLAFYLLASVVGARLLHDGTVNPVSWTLTLTALAVLTILAPPLTQAWQAWNHRLPSIEKA